MRTEQLEYVAAVARLGTFRGAAEELHISQPALSATVRNLERELGVTILERGRSGTRVSAAGLELLPHIAAVIDAASELRKAANRHHQSARMVRIGTVNAATVPLLAPAIAEFRAANETTQVEVIGAQEEQIDRSLREGSLDLGLISCLFGDDMPTDLETTVLMRGRAVVCIRTDSSLADRDSVTVREILAQPLVLMRAGYLMHRFVHRLFDGHQPTISYTTDGGEMGKLMVAEGLGVTVLPDFSVTGDPLERSGLITSRPIEGDETEVRLAVRRRPGGAQSLAVRQLHGILVSRAEEYEALAGGDQKNPSDGSREPLITTSPIARAS